jgi:hypothetical protein
MRRFFLLLLILSTVRPAAAEEIDRYGRFVLGGRLGPGRAWVSEDVPGSTRGDHGLGGGLHAGYGLTPGVVLGVESSFWNDADSSGDGDAQVDLRTFGPALTWFPWGQGLFLRGVVGWSWLDLDVQPAGGPRYLLSESGWGFSLALGWEWRLSRHLALAPRLDAAWMDTGEVDGLSQVLGEPVDFQAWWLNGTVQLTGYF